MSARTRAAWMAVVWLAGAACAPSDPIPARNLEQRLELGVPEVEFGVAFALRVTRIWSKDLEPDPWSEPQWEGIRIRELSRILREDNAREMETRNYEARAFSLQPELLLELPPWTARSSRGSGSQIARAEPHTLKVIPTVNHAEPGSDELPVDLEESTTATIWPLVLFLLTMALWLGLRLTRKRAAPRLIPPALAVEFDYRAVARARIAALRETSGEGQAQDRAFHEEAFALVRDFLDAQGTPFAQARTSEELLRLIRDRAGARRLPPAFAACDRVKFGKDSSTHERREALLAALDSFLEESA